MKLSITGVGLTTGSGPTEPPTGDKVTWNVSDPAIEVDTTGERDEAADVIFPSDRVVDAVVTATFKGETQSVRVVSDPNGPRLTVEPSAGVATATATRRR